MDETTTISDAEFGLIAISYRTGMKHINARWKKGKLNVHAPHHTPLAGIICFIDQYRDKLLKLKLASAAKTEESTTYYIGQRIPCFRNEILITTHDCKPNVTGYCDDHDKLSVFISKLDDISTPTKRIAISGALKELMKRKAPSALIPYAEEVARQIGVSPSRYEIGRGLRKLGHCTNKKVIQLSYNLMFMPECLVRYIICHELAHLTEMNHSQRFHDLCDSYCDGKEKALKQMLKGFKFPVIQ